MSDCNSLSVVQFLTLQSKRWVSQIQMTYLKKCVCSVVSNCNFLLLIKLILTSALTINLCKLVATKIIISRKKSSGSVGFSAKIHVIGAVAQWSGIHACHR